MENSSRSYLNSNLNIRADPTTHTHYIAAFYFRKTPINTHICKTMYSTILVLTLAASTLAVPTTFQTTVAKAQAACGPASELSCCSERESFTGRFISDWVCDKIVAPAGSTVPLSKYCDGIPACCDPDTSSDEDEIVDIHCIAVGSLL
ncbi:hypothetical protein ABW19_dt0204024 [Dactylella cylindrospora]|nr:hypothetical protein ABW19_dt0204024 [Dactylella cylindrospora]